MVEEVNNKEEACQQTKQRATEERAG